MPLQAPHARAATLRTRRPSGLIVGLLALVPFWNFGCSGDAGEESQRATIGAPAAAEHEAPLPNGGVTPPTDLVAPDTEGSPVLTTGGTRPESEAPLPAAPTPVSPVVDPVSTTPQPPAQSGLLTAGVWDDNLNLDRFFEYYDEAWVDPATGRDGALSFTKDDYRSAAEEHELKAHDVLDLALILDATGSMGDEIRYLQAEFEDLNERIHAAYPDAEQRWSLVVYRDEHDDFITQVYDFNTDAEAFSVLLAKQTAGGGGDIPEASHAALAAMNQLAWRDDEATARLAFWVADAPHHGRYAKEMRDAIVDAQERDIHIYPVFASGPDPFTEFSMRSAAQLTGGRYLFLTNDSGVGGNHQEPNIACYYVTPLSEAILRVVETEMSGEQVDVSPNSIVRKVGNPVDNVCQLASGKTATAF